MDKNILFEICFKTAKLNVTAIVLIELKLYITEKISSPCILNGKIVKDRESKKLKGV